MREAWAAADRVQGGGVVGTPLVSSSWAAQQASLYTNLCASASMLGDCFDLGSQHGVSVCQAGIGRMMLKLENRQTTGSFKLRGAVNKVLHICFSMLSLFQSVR